MMYRNKLSLQPQSCNRYNHLTKPRTVIYTDKNTQAWYVESLSTGDLTVIQTKIRNRSTMIISCYLDINIKDVIPHELNKALEYAQQQGLAVIIGMDSNAHSSSFGDKTNKRGDKLDLFISGIRPAAQTAKKDDSPFSGIQPVHKQLDRTTHQTSQNSLEITIDPRG